MSLRWIFSAMTLRRGLGEFARAERGSVTLQVLLMSIALLGTTGLVLDSGRLYSRHTAMQAYTDAMALAGAAELDGQPDSISRARAAMVGLGDNPYLSKFDSQGNEFKINNIYFFTDLNASSGTSIEMQTLVDSAGFVILDESEADRTMPGKKCLIVFTPSNTRYLVEKVPAWASALSKKRQIFTKAASNCYPTPPKES